MTTLNETTFGHEDWHIDVSGEVYIETGVGNGDSFAAAVEHSFKHLIGIEVNETLARSCAKKFASDERVKIVGGDSAFWLPLVIDPSRKTVFWLDAHCEQGVPQSLGESGQCPLLDELRIICAADWKHKPVIMIDDYAAFMSNDWWKRYASPEHDPDQWPDWWQIFDAMGGLEYKWTFLASPQGILYCW